MYSAFHYPLYNCIHFILGGGNSFYDMHNAFYDSLSYFGEMTKDMGIFLDNHDVIRFLHDFNDSVRLDNALTMVHTWTGIPFVYYGTEQDMDGSSDPDNRVPLWEYGYNTTSHHYLWCKTLNKYRDIIPYDTLDQKELYWDDHFYAFSRGDRALVIL